VTDVPTTQAQQPRQLTKYEAIKQQLTSMQASFAAALPPQVRPEKFLGVVLTGLRLNEKLQNADRTTLYGACLKCAQDGLLPDGREAALVLFGDKVQYMPMIGGILKKVRNSGEIKKVSVQVVYSNDEFDYARGDEEWIKHKPALGERGEFVAAYAIAWLANGERQFEVMDAAQIEKVRNVSRAKNNGPWVDFTDEMRRKTVFRRLAKLLPQSTDLQQVLEHDNENYDLTEQPKPPANPMAALKQRIGVSKPEPQPQEPPLPDSEAEFRGDAESMGGDA
jgi:recombination protein RecT